MISFQTENKIFHIRTRNTSYLFQVRESLINLYWGAKIDLQDAGSFLRGGFHSSFDLNTNMERDEFPCWNGRSYTVPCLNLQRGETRYLFPKFCRYKIIAKSNGIETLDIFLEDKKMMVDLNLHYQVYEKYDIIARSVTLTNKGEKLQLTNICSACANLPQSGEQYLLRYVTGKWAGEWQLCEQQIHTGLMEIQAKRGITGPHFNPSFAISDNNAAEEYGRVWFGILGYSGNWKISVEKTIFNNVHIAAGINNFDFSYNLASGESFNTPLIV